jgi:hypothetical protein
MFAALTLSMALGAPVPAPAAPVETGVAPRVMELKANADGKIMVTVTRPEKVQVGAGAAINPAGGAAPAVITREIPVAKNVELGDVKDLSVTTADGKKLTAEEAMKKLAGGAIVVVSGDGKPVSPAFLKVFKDDTLVLVSPELAGPQVGTVKPGIRPLPADRLPPAPPGGVQILPINPGGVIQIQVQPGNVAPAVLPAQPPVPVEKGPPKNEK